MKRVLRGYLTRDLLNALSARRFEGLVFDTKVRGFFVQMYYPEKYRGAECNFFVRVKGKRNRRYTFSLIAGCGLSCGGHSPSDARDLAREYTRVYGVPYRKDECSTCLRNSDSYLYEGARSGRRVCLRCEIELRYKRFIRMREARIHNDIYRLKRAIKEMET